MTEEWKDLEQDVPTLTLDPGMLKEEKTKSQVLTEERQPEPMDEKCSPLRKNEKWWMRLQPRSI